MDAGELAAGDVGGHVGDDRADVGGPAGAVVSPVEGRLMFARTRRPVVSVMTSCFVFGGER